MTIKNALRATAYQSRLGLEVLPGCNLLNLTDAQKHELKQSLWKHGVVVVKNQNLTASELEEFARKTFGSLMFGRNSFTLDPDITPDIQSQYTAILGNPKGFDQEPAEKIYGARVWHQDKDGVPRIEELDMNALYVVMLYSIKVPEEGENGQPHTTEYLDLVEAYNNLDSSQQQELAEISMYQMSPIFARPNIAWDDAPKKVHPIVSTHKVTGQKGLYLGSWNTAIPLGMENQREAAQKYWQDLFETVLKRTPVYSHVWEPGDVTLWDNSQVMHRGTFYDSTQYQRIALRLGVVDC
ncbi:MULTISPECIES: TauD/TfdA dioxygenase family protein [Calothrix]|uniref:TauD/TfdA family dioxygenase n=2 Tax=Calothrix TaxID=1186 RepID=A0ABR8A931_9CYAN|nr:MULTISPECIES: TauD/TfdA family dioxygenase [Calothrix]MBD2196344.1 TauD/TfdA family dioxygenase [Calothrix parietina FACHB-288]MBD2225260.1 TauD/TfdA family dioxygenase [Calothrix anomala FACHB-343]